MNYDFNGYIPTDRHFVGVMAASTLFHSILNSLNTSMLEKITKTYVLFHIAVLVACCIALLVCCHNKEGLGLHSSTYVWTEVVNNSGWRPNGWSWLFGFLSASWAMTVSPFPLFTMSSLTESQPGLRRNSPHSRRNQEPRSQSALVHRRRTARHLARRLALHHRTRIRDRRSYRQTRLCHQTARCANLLRRLGPARGHFLHHRRLHRPQLHSHDGHTRWFTHNMGICEG